MLYLEDIKLGDRFISRKYKMTLEEIQQFAYAFDPQVFHTDENRPKTILFFKGLLQVAGIRLRSLCVYGQNVFQLPMD